VAFENDKEGSKPIKKDTHKQKEILKPKEIQKEESKPILKRS